MHLDKIFLMQLRIIKPVIYTDVGSDFAVISKNGFYEECIYNTDARCVF
jgi:hypothetical protein